MEKNIEDRVETITYINIDNLFLKEVGNGASKVFVFRYAWAGESVDVIFEHPVAIKTKKGYFLDSDYLETFVTEAERTILKRHGSSHKLKRLFN